jgi:surface antigen
MQKQKIKSVIRRRVMRVPFFALVLLVIIGTVVMPKVRADQFDQQINAISQDTSSKQQSQAQLGAQAANLTDTVSSLQSQIATLQDQITANQAKVADLQTQITQAEADLAKQKETLSESIKTIYLEGQISTLEMLASSKDLSQFVDKQQYRNTVQDKIKNMLDSINTLKAQLKTQKQQVEQSLADQQAIQSRLDGQRAQQTYLLNLNQSQQSALNTQIQQNNVQIAVLRAQQIAANARFIGNAGNGPACGGGYPGKWCEIRQDYVIDNWGMYNRECVSYTAFRVAVSGRHMPFWGGVGNANQWDDDAIAEGIPVDGTPRAGDVAISNAGAYGHAMYVESVNANGTINISQYNAALNGTFSTNTISVGSLVFIHFP